MYDMVNSQKTALENDKNISDDLRHKWGKSESCGGKGGKIKSGLRQTSGRRKHRTDSYYFYFFTTQKLILSLTFWEMTNDSNVKKSYKNCVCPSIDELVLGGPTSPSIRQSRTKFCIDLSRLFFVFPQQLHRSPSGLAIRTSLCLLFGRTLARHLLQLLFPNFYKVAKIDLVLSKVQHFFVNEGGGCCLPVLPTELEINVLYKELHGMSRCVWALVIRVMRVIRVIRGNKFSDRERPIVGFYTKCLQQWISVSESSKHHLNILTKNPYMCLFSFFAMPETEIFNIDV